MSDWTGPAYDAVELLGYGPAAEVWRGRVRATGERVVLRRLTAARPGLAEAVRELPRSPHLLRVRDVVGDDVLVVEHAPGGSLEALLARRGLLSPGEVVTALAPVAQLLTSVRHGAVRASSVLLDATGRPLLEVPGDGEGDDVVDLGELAHRCLAGTDPELPSTVPLPLAEVVRAARAGEVTREELAERLLAACPAAPLEGLGPGPARDAHPSRRLLPVVGAVAGLAAVVAAGWGWGRHTGAGEATELPPRAPTSSATGVATPVATPVATDWRRVLAGLDAARAAAFARGDVRLLDAVYAPSSPLRGADVRSIRLLGSASGAGHEVAAVRVGRASGVRVVLVVRERLAGGPWAQHRVVLVRTGAGWRVERVSG